jgi:paired small multidrug resistance pump
MNLQLQWWDWVGLCGTASILLGFFLLQAGKLHGQRILFQLMNLFGALGILVSLYGKFNLSVFLLESTWLVISGFGIWTSWKRKQRMQAQHPPVAK